MEPKSYFREAARKYRASLSARDIESASAIVCEGLKQAADWGQIKSLHCYKAFNSEIDPARFIAWVSENHGMATYFQDLSGDFPEDKFEAVIVPGLAFDRRGNRIGYGKGHYDRFLAEQPKALKIGLCYDELVFPKLPHEKHDIPVSEVITETELYN